MWEGSRTLWCWVVQEGWAGLSSPDQNWRGCSGIPAQPAEEAPASPEPSPNRSGDFLRPSCRPLEESESERGKGGFGAEKIAAS